MFASGRVRSLISKIFNWKCLKKWGLDKKGWRKSRGGMTLNETM